MSKSKAKYEVQGVTHREVATLLGKVLSDYSAEQELMMLGTQDEQCACRLCADKQGGRGLQLQLQANAKRLDRHFKKEVKVATYKEKKQQSESLVSAARTIQHFVRLSRPAMRRWQQVERANHSWTAKRAYVIVVDYGRSPAYQHPPVDCKDTAQEIGRCLEMFGFETEYWTGSSPDPATVPTRANLVALVEACKAAPTELRVLYIAAKGAEGKLAGYAPPKKQHPRASGSGSGSTGGGASGGVCGSGGTSGGATPRTRLAKTLQIHTASQSSEAHALRYIIPAEAAKEAHDTVVVLDDLLDIVRSVPQQSVGCYSVPTVSRVLFLDVWPARPPTAAAVAAAAGGGASALPPMAPSLSMRSLKACRDEAAAAALAAAAAASAAAAAPRMAGYALIASTATAEVTFGYGGARRPGCRAGLFSVVLQRALYGAACDAATGLNVTNVVRHVFQAMVQHHKVPATVHDVWRRADGAGAGGALTAASSLRRLQRVRQPEGDGALVARASPAAGGASASAAPCLEGDAAVRREPWKRCRGPLGGGVQLTLAAAETPLAHDLVASSLAAAAPTPRSHSLRSGGGGGRGGAGRRESEMPGGGGAAAAAAAAEPLLGPQSLAKRMTVAFTFSLSVVASAAAYVAPQTLLDEAAAYLNGVAAREAAGAGAARVHAHGRVAPLRTLKLVFRMPLREGQQLLRSGHLAARLEGRIAYVSMRVEPEPPALRSSVGGVRAHLQREGVGGAAAAEELVAVYLEGCGDGAFLTTAGSVLNEPAGGGGGGSGGSSERRSSLSDAAGNARGFPSPAFQPARWPEEGGGGAVPACDELEVLRGVLGTGAPPLHAACALVEACFFTTGNTLTLLDGAVRSGLCAAAAEDPLLQAALFEAGGKRRSRTSLAVALAQSPFSAIAVGPPSTSAALPPPAATAAAGAAPLALRSLQRGVTSLFDIDQETLRMYPLVLVLCVAAHSPEHKAKAVSLLHPYAQQHHPKHCAFYYLDFHAYEKELKGLRKNPYLNAWVRLLVDSTHPSVVSNGGSQIFLSDMRRSRNYTYSADRGKGSAAVSGVPPLLEDFAKGTLQDLVPPVKGSKVFGFGTRLAKYTLLPAVDKDLPRVCRVPSPPVSAQLRSRDALPVA